MLTQRPHAPACGILSIEDGVRRGQVRIKKPEGIERGNEGRGGRVLKACSRLYRVFPCQLYLC